MYPPYRDIGQQPSESSKRISHQGKQIYERSILSFEIFFKIISAIYDMGMCVRLRIMVVVVLGIQLRLQIFFDIGEILLPYPDIHVVVPRNESVMPYSSDGRTVAQIISNPVGIQYLGDILIHRKKTGLSFIHHFQRGHDSIYNIIFSPED